VGGSAFGCRVFGHLGFAHSRRLRPGIGRRASATDSFGSPRDASPERRISERRIGAGIRFDRERTFDPDVGCVFDIDFGLAKVAPGNRFVIRSDAACFKHIGTDAEVGCSANTASRHSSAHVRGACKIQRDTNRLYARPSARVECICVCIRLCVSIRLRVRARLRVCTRLRVCGRFRVRGHRTDASRQLGSSNRFGHTPRGPGKANIRGVSRRQTPRGVLCTVPHSAAHWLRNGHAFRDGRKTSAEVGDTNNTASTARSRRLATAGSEGTAAAGKARKLARIGSPTNVGSSSNIGSFGGTWCLDRIWTGPRAGTNISRGTNLARTAVSIAHSCRAFCSAHDHRHRIDIGPMDKVRHHVDRQHRLRITARPIGGAIVDCHAVDIGDLAPVRSGSRARSDRSNTIRCGV
jgi:hypothetical protein